MWWHKSEDMWFVIFWERQAGLIGMNGDLSMMKMGRGK